MNFLINQVIFDKSTNQNKMKAVNKVVRTPDIHTLVSVVLEIFRTFNYYRFNTKASLNYNYGADSHTNTQKNTRRIN